MEPGEIYIEPSVGADVLTGAARRGRSVGEGDANLIPQAPVHSTNGQGAQH